MMGFAALLNDFALTMAPIVPVVLKESVFVDAVSVPMVVLHVTVDAVNQVKHATDSSAILLDDHQQTTIKRVDTSFRMLVSRERVSAGNVPTRKDRSRHSRGMPDDRLTTGTKGDCQTAYTVVAQRTKMTELVKKGV